MNERRLTLLAIALSSTLSAGVAYSQAQTAPPTKKAPEKTAASATLSAQDRKFVNTAGEAGAAEVAMGQLAESHSASADVKGFAARVVSDHQKAGDELKSIAEAKGRDTAGRIIEEGSGRSRQALQAAGFGFRQGLHQDAVIGQQERRRAVRNRIEKRQGRAAEAVRVDYASNARGPPADGAAALQDNQVLGAGAQALRVSSTRFPTRTRHQRA